MIAGAQKERLRSRILEIGFDVARFTNLGPLSGDQLKDWIAKGYHADMEWLARSIGKRLDPGQVLKGACSALLLGVNYLPGKEQRARRQNRFAKYSLYRDYHDTILEGLKRVGAMLEREHALSGEDYRYYVDTGPVVERAWAQAAGLGWQGRNGMLISRKHGNWLLLATVLMRLETEPDAPLKKRMPHAPETAHGPEGVGLLCGKCRRCIDACPTDAIVADGVVDARRCISYHTIENKGWIPRELRARFGGRIFGCDICLDACPWNRFAEAGRAVLLEARFDPASLSLLELLGMGMEQYRRVFRKMPQKRSKLRGLLRNACVAAGNLRDCSDWWPREAQPGSAGAESFLGSVRAALLRLALDEEAVVRGHAVWALYRLFGEEATDDLADARLRESDPRALEEHRLGSTLSYPAC